MATMDTWTAEFCTVCDKQCFLGSVYCSDTCREADHHSEQRYHPLSPLQSLTDVAHASHDTDSSDENGEIPNFWLGTNASGQASKKDAASKLRSSASKPSDLAFRYASPILKPQKITSTTAVSPLLIPQSSQVPTSDKEEQISAQSVSTYKRWLSQGTV